MASKFNQEIVSSKIGFLTKQRDFLSEQRDCLDKLIDEANKILQLGISWLRSGDDSNNSTFAEVNKIIEDKLVCLSGTCLSVSPEKITMDQESATTRFLLSNSASTDQHIAPTTAAGNHPFPAQYNEVSNTSVVADELNSITNQVKVLQDALSHLTTSTEKISEKQLDMEKNVESLLVKYSTIDEEKVNHIETELQNIFEKQKTTYEQQDIRIKSLENSLQAVTDDQSDIVKNNLVQQTKLNKHKKENEKQAHQFTQDLGVVLENNRELNIRVCLLENQTLMDTQLESLEHKVTFLEANSKGLSEKLEGLSSTFEEFTKRTDETFAHFSNADIREFENLQHFEEKAKNLEMELRNTAQETDKFHKDIETKYQMVCQVVTDRLALLEKLRGIFNKKLKGRKENIEKLEGVCKQMANILPKFSQLEIERQGQAIGFSARVPWDTHPVTETTLRNFTDVISNNGKHFDPITGVFTTPLNGLYATSLFVQRSGAGKLSLAITKLPCECHCDTKRCRLCTICAVVTESDDRNTSVFVVVSLKAGEKLSVICNSADNSVIVLPCTVFTCIKIG